MRLVVGEFLAQLFIEAIIVSPRGDEIGRRITQYGDFLNFGVIYTNTTTATIYSYSYYFYVFYWTIPFDLVKNARFRYSGNVLRISS